MNWEREEIFHPGDKTTPIIHVTMEFIKEFLFIYLFIYLFNNVLSGSKLGLLQ
jgi:hypothetical protein